MKVDWSRTHHHNRTPPTSLWSFWLLRQNQLHFDFETNQSVLRNLRTLACNLMKCLDTVVRTKHFSWHCKKQLFQCYFELRLSQIRKSFPFFRPGATKSPPLKLLWFATFSNTIIGKIIFISNISHFMYFLQLKKLSAPFKAFHLMCSISFPLYRYLIFTTFFLKQTFCRSFSMLKFFENRK